MVRHPYWAVGLLLLPGCLTMGGFNRDLLEARVREPGARDVDKEIKPIQALRPQLQFPCRIAVALKNDRGDWRWSARDRQVMEGWATTLRTEGVASDVVFMSRMFSGGESLTELRASAAKFGADALLLIKATSATESRHNPLAVLNLTVVGGFVIPASHRDALFLMEGALIDVNNGFLYAALETEGEGTTLGPTFVIEEKDAVERAKQKALTAFGPELLRRMVALRSSEPAVLPIGRVVPRPAVSLTGHLP